MSFFQDLNSCQVEAVSHGEGPLLILAGAGSGKTRVITYRIAHLLSQGASPWDILAVTFTNKGAEEMRKRVDALVPGKGRSVWVSTFHSFCAKFLRQEAKNIGLNPDFTIYDDDDQKKAVRECLTELSLDEKKHRPPAFVNLISRAKDELMDAGSYIIHAETHHDPFRKLAASVYEKYEKKLRISNSLDFGDLIMRTVFALRDFPVIRERYQRRFRHILVDEYQDTNRAQYMLVKSLVSPPRNICVVGDDDQSIYSWRGGDIRNILEFERDFQGARVIKLEQNYRSTPQILEAAWKVIKHNENRKKKKLWTEKKEGHPVTFQEFATEIEEARGVVQEIKNLREQEDAALRDFSIFYRTNAQSRVLEDALRREGIPYVIVGAVRFYERKEVKDLLAYLRLIVNPSDSLSLRRVINVPQRGIGKASLEILSKNAAERDVPLLIALQDAAHIEGISASARRGLRDFFHLYERCSERAAHMKVPELVRYVLEQSGYKKYLEAESEKDPEAVERLSNISELVNATEEFCERSEDQSVSGFLEQVSLVAGIDSWDDTKDFVTLMTVHLAKGLEFPTVFLTGMEEGLFPIGESAYSQGELEEERRICYVGMTRAKERLYLSSSAERRLYGRAHWNVPSRFVDEAGIRKGFGSPEPDHEILPRRETQVRSVEERRSGRFRIGQRVRHRDYGEGKIIEKSGSDDNTKIVVLFNDGKWRKLLIKYAPLELV